MSLSVRFRITQTANRRGLVLSDTTGAYNAISNPGGYGAPNPATTDATIVTIYVTDLGGVTYPIDASASLPSATGGTFVINNVDIGLTSDSEIPDGYYIVQYELQDNSGIIGSSTQQVLVSGQVACCIRKIGAKKSGGCGKNKFAEARLGYEAMLAADECNDIHKAKKILAHLQKECQGCGCGCK
jgi:hypothetical protein